MDSIESCHHVSILDLLARSPVVAAALPIERLLPLLTSAVVMFADVLRFSNQVHARNHAETVEMAVECRGKH